MEFNRLFMDNFDDDDSYAYRFTMYREIAPRKPGYTHDPITKCCFTFSQGFNYSVALHESGKFEIYWNMMKIESPEDSKYQ